MKKILTVMLVVGLQLRTQLRARSRQPMKTAGQRLSIPRAEVS